MMNYSTTLWWQIKRAALGTENMLVISSACPEKWIQFKMRHHWSWQYNELLFLWNYTSQTLTVQVYKDGQHESYNHADVCSTCSECSTGNVNVELGRDKDMRICESEALQFFFKSCRGKMLDGKLLVNRWSWALNGSFEPMLLMKLSKWLHKSFTSPALQLNYNTSIIIFHNQFNVFVFSVTLLICFEMNRHLCHINL